MILFFILISSIKLLFIPAYRSTDFEVHRNWLAITHSLPLKQWYFEETSEWTLDYPPFFAYFEYLLSHVAKFFDINMLNVNNLNYASYNTILFQRLSVIFTDIIYFIGVNRCSKAFNNKKTSHLVTLALLLSNIGLIMVDHMHFQYNGILFGILMISISYLMTEKYLLSAFYFAVLLNMKHIFIYIAPVYIVYLFKYYCMRNGYFMINSIKLSAVLLCVAIVSIGPFYDQIPQLIKRLFPFKRGLSHAYWAPNIWALYNFMDRILAKIFNINLPTSTTSGLVQSFEHTVLPSITPLTTFLLTAGAMLPLIIKLSLLKYNRMKTPVDFLRAIILCGCTSFMFGWHVHEKAILMVILPLILLAVQNKEDAELSIVLTTIGHYSLLPLFFTSEMIPIKIFLFLTYTILYKYCLSIIHSQITMKLHQKMYFLGLFLLTFYENTLHLFLGFDKKFPFLPLLLTSVYCSIGITYFWINYYYKFLMTKNIDVNKKTKKK